MLAQNRPVEQVLPHRCTGMASPLVPCCPQDFSPARWYSAPPFRPAGSDTVTDQSMIPDNPELTRRLQGWLERQDDSVFTWVECHGLACAMAVLPSPPEDWQQAISSESQLPEEVREQLESVRQRLAARLAAGEVPVLPCRLDPYEENEGRDLAAWCIGFMAGVCLEDTLFFGEDDSEMAEKLLPVVLIAGVDEDPALDELWEDSKLTRQMAFAIPDLLQELFLDFQAPELGQDQEDED